MLDALSGFPFSCCREIMGDSDQSAAQGGQAPVPGLAALLSSEYVDTPLPKTAVPKVAASSGSPVASTHAVPGR